MPRECAQLRIPEEWDQIKACLQMDKEVSELPEDLQKVVRRGREKNLWRVEDDRVYYNDKEWPSRNEAVRIVGYEATKYHENNPHGGLERFFNHVRQTYWVTRDMCHDALQEVKKEVHPSTSQEVKKEVHPSTSQEVKKEVQPSTSQEVKKEVQPSTSLVTGACRSSFTSQVDDLTSRFPRLTTGEDLRPASHNPQEFEGPPELNSSSESKRPKDADAVLQKEAEDDDLEDSLTTSNQKAQHKTDQRLPNYLNYSNPVEYLVNRGQVDQLINNTSYNYLKSRGHALRAEYSLEDTLQDAQEVLPSLSDMKKSSGDLGITPARLENIIAEIEKEPETSHTCGQNMDIDV